MKSRTCFIVLSINFILLSLIGINYIHGQGSNLGIMNDTSKVSETLTPDSLNETRFNSNNERNNSLNDTTKVSEILTPDSLNETRFSDLR